MFFRPLILFVALAVALSTTTVFAQSVLFWDIDSRLSKHETKGPLKAASVSDCIDYTEKFIADIDWICFDFSVNTPLEETAIKEAYLSRGKMTKQKRSVMILKFDHSCCLVGSRDTSKFTLLAPKIGPQPQKKMPIVSIKPSSKGSTILTLSFADISGLQGADEKTARAAAVIANTKRVAAKQTPTSPRYMIFADCGAAIHRSRNYYPLFAYLTGTSKCLSRLLPLPQPTTVDRTVEHYIFSDDTTHVTRVGENSINVYSVPGIQAKKFGSAYSRVFPILVSLVNRIGDSNK